MVKNSMFFFFFFYNNVYTKNKLKNTYNSAPTTILCVVKGKLNARTKVYK